MQNCAKTKQPRLILASSSPYRRIQLQQLVEEFECVSPDVDESRLPDENAADMVERLALAKARHVATLQPDAIVIGSDQAAVLGDQILGKPGNRENARRQLALCSGNCVEFQTAVAVIQAKKGMEKLARINTEVEFRILTSEEIFRYVEKDNPVDCAGSFKIEGSGSVLFTKVISPDPSALVGLPLIATANLLRRAGVALP